MSSELADKDEDHGGTLGILSNSAEHEQGEVCRMVIDDSVVNNAMDRKME